MSQSNIEWTDVTDNIVVAARGGWWCRRISEGCDNCYAAKLNQNGFYGGNKLDYSGQAPALLLRHEILESWAKQTKPKKHFVASMTDVFGEWVGDAWIYQFLDAMMAAHKQTFQVLTKRSAVMRRRVIEWLKMRKIAAVPSNIWLGVSVENQKWADIRIPDLLSIPAKVRFLSCEPLIGPIHFGSLIDGIHWNITGGESGPKKRPMKLEWARSLRDQCAAAGVAYFFKQVDKIQPIPEDLMIRQFPSVTVLRKAPAACAVGANL